MELYEDTLTRVYFEPGYVIEPGDLVVFVHKRSPTCTLGAVRRAC